MLNMVKSKDIRDIVVGGLKHYVIIIILNIFLELFDNYDPEIGFGGARGRGRRKQDPPIERELYLTLEEVFKGCTKKMKISRRVSN